MIRSELLRPGLKRRHCLERRHYSEDTRLDVTYPWGMYVGGRAMCSDGTVRRLHRIAPTADTFFSVPASVQVSRDGQRRTVSGYVTVETRSGMSTETIGDPSVVKFVAVTYGRNHDALPDGKWTAEAEAVR